MNKMVYSLLAAGFVSGSGLVSCSKEIKTQDVYRVPTPVIVREGETADIKSWDQRSEKILDLHDAFDVSAGKPEKITIESKCKVDGKNVTTKFVQEKPVRIYLFQLLPDSLLVQDKLDSDCSFTLKMTNAIGSAMIFKMEASQIRENREGNVTLEQEDAGENKSRPRFVPRAKKSFRARFDNRAPALARVLCPNITTRALAFDHVIELSQFDYQAAREANTRAQTCRVVITQAGAPGGISPLFLVEPYELRPLKIEVVRNHLARPLAYITGDSKILLDEIRITNPNNFQRVLKLADDRQTVMALVTLKGSHVQPPPKVKLQKQGLALVPQEDIAPWNVLVVEPGETKTFHLTLFTQRMTCAGPVIGLTLKPEKPFGFLDVDDKGNVLSRNEVEITESRWTQQIPNQGNGMGPWVNASCQWPDVKN